jgi:hypothetical protein
MPRPPIPPSPYAARPTIAALAAAFLILGSTLVNYDAIELSIGHGSGIGATAFLVWYWLRTYGSPRGTRWLAVGALVGLATLMRWQLATPGRLGYKDSRLILVTYRLVL